MDEKRYNLYINVFIYLYLVLPTLIFLIGWLKWYWALPIGVLVLISCIKGLRESIHDRCLLLSCSIEAKTMFPALLIIVLWVYISGVGGYFYQNGDHEIRNAIFHALVERDWPVVSADGSRGLIYYIGFWLPAACIGKVFGLESGFAAQAAWAVMGIFIVYYLICVYRNKVDLLIIVFLIFFSGLDYVGTCIVRDPGVNLKLALHLEWWVNFQFSSITTQLFWVFNQAIPAWIATCLIMVQKNCRNMLFILAMIMLTSTFPFVGLIPIVLFFYVKYVIEDRRRWIEIVTFQNIIGVFVVGIVVFLYLIGNTHGGTVIRNSVNTAALKLAASGTLTAGVLAQRVGISEAETMQLAKLGIKLFLFYFLEFGIYLCFICKYRKNDPMVWLLSCILVICPFIKVGQGDFCMRASIPALFILMLFCVEAFEKIRLDGKKYLFGIYCTVFLLGAITPFNEIHRSVRETVYKVANEESVRSPAIDVEDLLRLGNFSGETQDSIFYQYFVR